MGFPKIICKKDLLVTLRHALYCSYRKVISMKKHRAIPQGYMTVGELAKKMNTTVRTLQYYDNEGLFSPSAESEGGRRLYTDKDVVRLHQIQSLKYLGLSLGEIRNGLMSLDTPKDVVAVLAEQMGTIREDIASLSDALQALDKLKTEILQMETVDWMKYADIIGNLQHKNEFYGAIKHFDEKTMDHLHQRFNWDSGAAVVDKMTRLVNEANECQNNGIAPESERAQALAKEFWDMVMEVTGGDLSLLPNLNKGAIGTGNEEWNKRWALAEPYFSKIMDTYFANQNYNPLEGIEL